MIKSMQYSIAFAGLNLDEKNDRRAIEDLLPDFKFSILNMPPQAPAEIIRMSGATEHNHSLLNFSNVRADLYIQYDDKYNADPSKCFSYGNEKVSEVIDVLKQKNVNLNYIGVIVQHAIDISNPVMAIKEKIVKIEPLNKELFNLGVKFTLVHRDKFYVNVDITNWRLRDIRLGETPQVLGVTVDINNRYGMEIKDLNSDFDDWKEIEKIQYSITEAKINELLRTGEFVIAGE